ncbi:hypothetical protein ABPG75_013198 [Micractinium tetrahymenae]
MHGMDHAMDCQLQHSGLYASRAGARVGEQTEHLWALLKPFSKLVRYMSVHRWFDGINLALQSITRKRLAAFGALLRQRINNCGKKLENCKQVLTEVRAEAAQHGVRDLDAAERELAPSDSVPQKLSAGARYVESLLKLGGHDGLYNSKAALTLALPGSTGVQVHSNVADPAKRAKLAAEKDRAASAAGVGVADDDWSPGMPEYQAGAAELRTFKLRQLERQIEERVFKRKVLMHNQEQAESGKISVKAGKRIASERSTIQGLLAVRASWDAFPEACADGSAFDDAAVEQACSGEFPWASNGIGNGSPAAREHFARRYRTAKARVERYDKEAGYLQDETIRAANWAEEQAAAVSSRLAALRELQPGPGTAAAGQICVLERQLKLLALLAADIAALRHAMA